MKVSNHLGFVADKALITAGPAERGRPGEQNQEHENIHAKREKQEQAQG